MIDLDRLGELSLVADDAAAALERARFPLLQGSLKALRKATDEAARAWSGSNLGYHAIVYYQDIQPTPPGVQFSPEWGLMDRWPTHQPDRGWREMDYQSVINEIVRRAGKPDIESISEELESIREAFISLKERAISLLSGSQGQNQDPFLTRKYRQIESLEITAPQDIGRSLIGKGAGWSRDSTAVTQGYRLAPHQSLLAISLSAENMVKALDTLEKASLEAISHLQPAQNSVGPQTPPLAQSGATLQAKLFAQYDELAADIARSKHQFFKGNVKRWLHFLDSTAPFARPILQELESQADFKIWFEPYRVVAMGGGGGKDIEWPDARAKRLGTQLLLFRQFANGGIDPATFALTLLRSGSNANNCIAEIVNQIFLPMSQELRRYLQESTEPSGETISRAPASDRIVSFDHNSQVYVQTTEELDQLLEALEQVNDYPDIEDKEQKLAELSAGRRLLRATRVRYGLIVGVLGPPLAWLGKTFAGGIVGQLATSVWQGLKGLLGL
jgi:hypothetical protein